MAHEIRLPEQLFAAWDWIDSAGEWDAALADPQQYATDAYANAVEEWPDHGKPDFTRAELLDAIRWECSLQGIA